MSKFKVSFIVLLASFLFSPLSFASFDGDSNTDFISVQAASGHGVINWFEYDRTAGSVQWRTIVDSYTEEFYSVLSGDFDGDMRVDLLVGADDTVYWYESYQNDQVTLVDSFYVGAQVNSLSFDTLLPGRVYVAAGTDAVDPNDWISELGRIDVNSNDSAVYTSLTSNSKQQFISVTPSDFDQDGLVELLVGLKSYSATNPEYGHTALFEVQPDGSVTYIKLAVTGWLGGNDNAVFDFDGDGSDELFISGGSTSYGVTSWYEWDGNDNGFYYIGKALSGRSGRLYAGDVDGDSAGDFLFASYYASGWLENSGVDNGLNWNGNVFGGTSGHVLVVGDWDGDGIKDVIYGSDDSAGKLVGLHTYKVTGDNAISWNGALAGSAYYMKDGVMIEPASASDSLEIVRGQVEDYNLGLSASVAETMAQSALDAIQPDGSWSDITYGTVAVENWQVVTHYSRILDMALGYSKPGQSLYQSSALITAIENALNYGQDNIFTINGSGRPNQDGNWWYWQISLPKRLGKALIFIQDEINVAIFTEARDSLVWLAGENIPVWEGANLADTAEVHTYLSLVDADVNLLVDVKDAFESLLTFQATGHEGIKEDLSFHQHGPIPYSGSYGKDFLTSVCVYVGKYAVNTGFQVDDSYVETLVDYLLQGTNHFKINGYWDTGVLGRAVTRGDQNPENIPGISLLTDLEGDFADDIDAYLANPNDLEGHRYFWESDIATHHSDNWYGSVRMLSDRTVNAEAINGEGFKQWLVANGLVWFLPLGDEYVTNDVLAAMDWTRLPGVTVEQKTYTEAGYGYGDSDFVGGAYTESCGVSGMDFAYSGITDLTAKKSYFFFDDEVVCMGSDIDCSTSNTIETIVTQWPLTASNTPVFINGEVASTSAGWDETITDVTTTECENVGYYFPNGDTIKAVRKSQTGKWSDLNSTFGSTDLVTRDFLTLLYDHGTNISDASYLYAMVYPKGQSLVDYAMGMPFTALSHDDVAHAVRDRSTNTNAAVFWQSGTVDAVTVDTPCMVIWQIVGGKLSLALSEPTHATATITVTLDVPYTSLTNPVLTDGVSSQALGTESTLLTFAVENGRNYTAVFDTDIVSCLDIWQNGGGQQGDLNQDCQVDITDLSIFMNTWLEYAQPEDIFVQ